MKWVNHRVIASVTGLAITHNLAFSFVSMMFAVSPDQIEIHNYRTNTSLFKHRGMSHSFLLWLIVFGTIYGIITLINNPTANYYLIHERIFFAVVWGVLMHLMTDAMTIGGIPAFKPISHKYYAMKLFYTGDSTEYLVMYVFAAISILSVFLTHSAGLVII